MVQWVQPRNPGGALDRVLVTGGAGFIGSHIVDQLLAAGFEPHVVDNLSTGSRHNLPQGVNLYEVDICDAAALAEVFEAVRPRFVSHQAAQISVSLSVRDPVEDARVNVLGLLNVLSNSLRVGVQRVVFASSGWVLYGDAYEPASEDYPQRPVSPYGISKMVGEQYLAFFAREHGLAGIALRYANVYGPRQNPHGEAGVVAIFSERLLEGKPVTIFGDGRNIRDYVYVGDVARANLFALTAPLNNHFLLVNIGTGLGMDVVTLEANIRARAEAAFPASVHTRRSPLVFGSARPGDLRSSLLSGARALEVLGWKAETDLSDGLDLTVRWFAERAGLDLAAYETAVH